MAPVPRIPRDYGIALATPMLAFLFALLLAPGARDWHWPLFMAAVAVSALRGGVRFGLLAGGLSVVLLAFHHGLLLSERPPRPDAGFFPRLACFALLSCLASYLCTICKRSAAGTFQLPETLAGMHFGVIFADSRGRVTFLNSVAERLTGWPSADAVRERLGKVFLAVDEGGQQIAQNPVAQLLSDQSARGVGGSVLLLTRDGSERPVEFWAEPHQDARGRTWGVSLLFRDKSDDWHRDRELRERERLFHALADHAPASILVLDEAGESTYANTAFRALSGLTEEQVVGRGWTALVHPQDRQAADDWAVAARDGDSFSRELRIQDHRGQVRWVRLRAAAMPADDEQCLGHVGVLEEITVEKELEQQLQEHRQAREALLRHQQEIEAQHATKLGELEQAKAGVQEQLAKQRRAEEKLKQEQERLHKERKQLEEQLRQREADIGQWRGRLQQEEAKRERAEHNHRKEQELTQAQEKQLAEVNRRLAELTQAGSQLEQEQAERRRTEETLRQELQQVQAKAAQAEEHFTRREEALLADVTAYHDAQAQLRQQLLTLEQEARQREAALQQELAAGEEGRRRTEALAAAVRELAAAADPGAVVSKAVGLTRPLLADWCAAHVLEGDGSSISDTVDPGEQDLGLLRHPAYLTDVVGEIIRTAQPILYGKLSDSPLARSAQGTDEVQPPELAETALLGLPLVVHGKSVGALILLRGRSPDGFGPADRVLAEEFARHVGQALTGARLREELRALQGRFQERLAADQELERQRQRWDESSQRKEAFLDRFVQGVRQPLLRLRSAFNGLEARLGRDTGSRQAAAEMEGQVGRLMLLADGLHALTTLARGQLGLHKEEIELSSLLDSVCTAAEGFLQDRGHHLTVTLPLTPLTLSADRGRLEQVLLHLLHNAAQFTPSGGQLRLTAEPAGAELVLRVEDDGKGIRPERLADLFDLDAKSGRSEEDGEQGVGIGLAVVRGLVELHGGRVEAASEGPGRGSAFTVRLPLPEQAVLAVPEEPATLALPIQRMRRAG